MSDGSDPSRPAAGAAARALNTHDILGQIFQVDKRLKRRPKLSRKDLLRCAFVSRAFCEPALRALWRDMSPPDPLWRLLARSTPKSLTSDFLDVVLSEKTYTDPSRWSRFIWYARFVQKLHVTTVVWADTLKHQQLIRALVEHNGGESIFPSLQTMWWYPSSYSDSSYFPPFTAQIRSALFSFPCPKTEAMHLQDEDMKSYAFLTRLRTSSPRLTYLYLDMWRERIGASSSRVISLFEHLTRVNLTATISLASFRELATMPRMKSLQIAYVTLDEPDSEPSQYPVVQFDAPRLRLISVRGNCPSLTKLFTSLHAPLLRSASLYVMCDSGDYVSCIEALATVGASSAMKAIHIELDEDLGGRGNGWPPMCAHVNDLLGPLLVFRNVKHLSLACPTLPLVAADRDFDAFARAWRGLRTFELAEAYWAPRASTDRDVAIPTPKLLESFRDHCPHLRELTLPYLDLDADVPELKLYARYLLNGGRGSRHRLKRLSFGAKDPDDDSDSDDSDDSDDDDDDEAGEREAAAPALDGEKAMGWARYILALFPRLDAMYGLIECELSSATGWAEVFERVRALRKAQKRARVAESSRRGRASSVPVVSAG